MDVCVSLSVFVCMWLSVFVCMCVSGSVCDSACVSLYVCMCQTYIFNVLSRSCTCMAYAQEFVMHLHVQLCMCCHVAELDLTSCSQGSGTQDLP